MITASAVAAGFLALLVPLFVDAPALAVRFMRELPVIARALPDNSPRATIIFGGDMMFDRHIRTVAEQEGGDFIFSCIDDTLQGADLVVANLEGPITEHQSVSVGTKPPDLANFTFTFPTSTAILLARHNIGLVSLGNNHIMNFNEAGVMSTMVALADAGVGFFGSPLQSAFVRREVNGVPIEFVSYNEFGGSGADVAVHQIEFARENGYLPIVYAHWGEEYVPAREDEKALAHRFIDAGAEIVIGSHPHVVQEHELYPPKGEAGQGKHIYYSLGNLVFDQYWEQSVSTGLLLRVVFEKSGVVGIEEIPIELQPNGRTCVKAVE